LKIDLLPKITYPEIKVRISNPGVPAAIMEDEITRQLEEQLAITEDAIHVRSRSRQGRSNVSLSFEYGKDIDIAYRDASTRLDRAKRFLPQGIDPPVIYKRDPSQLPVAEYIVNAPLADPVELRDWADYTLSKWLLPIPGVAAAEVGGGLERQVQIIADQDRLAGMNLDILDIADTLKEQNRDIAGGNLKMPGSEVMGRTRGRFNAVEDIGQLRLELPGQEAQHAVTLSEVAKVFDGHGDEELMIRFNEKPGIKLSVQKQPGANTVEVVDLVNTKLDELKSQNIIPEDVSVDLVSDEARFIRRSLNNASLAAVSGAILAMVVVYLFLGNLRRTLIIGSAIPIAVLVTIILMALSDLTLNIMTLGGLALGIGMLVDSTIVMLENIYRHQREGKDRLQAPVNAASEVNSAIIASTSTNLAAVLPFLFIGGLIGLLFRELIFTVSAAIVASMLVALTLVPALAAKVHSTRESFMRRLINKVMEHAQAGYGWLLTRLLKAGWLIILVFILLLSYMAPPLLKNIEEFLPSMDDGRIGIYFTADRGTSVTAMDDIVQQVEAVVWEQPHVESMFTTTGGFVFGRSEFVSPNRGNIQVQLSPYRLRQSSSEAWIKEVQKQIWRKEFVGVNIWIKQHGIRGLRLNKGEDDLDFRIAGPDLSVLDKLGDDVLERLNSVEGIRNVKHSNQESNQELAIQVDRQRASKYGLSVKDIGDAVRFALAGRTVSKYLDGDRSVDILLRLESQDINSPGDLDEIILFSNTPAREPVRLSDVADVKLIPAPAKILREQQQRIVEVSASLTHERLLADVLDDAQLAIQDIEVPAGYKIFNAGSLEVIKTGQQLGYKLLALALFLVLVVMAVQYESIRNPLIILCSVAFGAIGVSWGLQWTETPISIPVWLGLIMLTGILVNNAIVLVEYIELQRNKGFAKIDAIVSAAKLRLRPILMTTLTTVVGMMPLALAFGEGSEMLQPLAITIVSGLSFSLLVTLVLIPAVYRYAGHNKSAIDQSSISSSNPGIAAADPR
ncbi:MAG: efflux RND transporter permease subunit, partial [bacterium]